MLTSLHLMSRYNSVKKQIIKISPSRCQMNSRISKYRYSEWIGKEILIIFKILSCLLAETEKSTAGLVRLFYFISWRVGLWLSSESFTLMGEIFT